MVSPVVDPVFRNRCRCHIVHAADTVISGHIDLHIATDIWINIPEG